MSTRQFLEGSPSNHLKRIFFAFLLCGAAIGLQAQTFTTLFRFDNVTSGAQPYSPLVQGFDGNFYGTTVGDDHTSYGSVFEITPAGSFTTLHTFDLGDSGGYLAIGGLSQASNGVFYGATYLGDFYSITSGGDFTTLAPLGGYGARATLTLGSDGNFYGTTELTGTHSAGTVFRITPSGVLTTLYNFCSQTNCTDGAVPYASLVEGYDGQLYGVTVGGGDPSCYALSLVGGCGTVFKITRDGIFTLLHTFEFSDGSQPYTTMILATDGSFYGVTNAGGNAGCEGYGCGTMFRMTPSGNLTTIFKFCGIPSCRGGSGPTWLIQGSDGNFYGATNSAVYELNAQREYIWLHSAYAATALTQATDGTFYGVDMLGGDKAGKCSGSGCGIVFNLATGLAPFVRTQPTLGSAGNLVIVIGNNLTGSTGVTFNGTNADFTVVSDTEITATVPSGATTGSVQVTTLTGTLSSNVPFRVRP